MMMKAVALLLMPPFCRVQILLFCSRILTRPVSAKCPRLHRCAHPIPPPIPLSARQGLHSSHQCMLANRPTALSSTTYHLPSHSLLP